MKTPSIVLKFSVAMAMVLLMMAAAPAGYEWQTVWSDEFDYTGMPDSTKWDYELGYRRNNEAQWYTKDPSNVYVDHGMLTITGKKLDTPVVSNGRTFNYSSASINTRGKYTVKYGRIEMRAKLPKTAGVWPAFWTLGTTGPWPKCGEIDIMEYFPNRFGINTTTSAFHYQPPPGTPGGTWVAKLADINPYDDFHIYAVEWSEAEMKFYFDDTLMGTLMSSDIQFANGTDPFNTAQYLLLNLALGGNENGTIDPDFKSEQYIIDYVRVSQLVKRGDPATQPAPITQPQPTTRPDTAPLAPPVPAKTGAAMLGIGGLLLRRRRS